MGCLRLIIDQMRPTWGQCAPGGRQSWQEPKGPPLMQCEGSQAGQREAVRVGLLCGRVEHIGEKSTGPISVSSRGRSCEGLGCNSHSSLLEPRGGSGSEERKQWFPEANLWDKDHC